MIGDRLNVLDLDQFSLDSQFFDSIFCSLRELIAFCSTHSENFNFLHSFPSPFTVIEFQLVNVRKKP
jgi:hypothetical protein